MLLCLQFFITSVMVVYIGILYLQSHYIFTSDYGYNKDEVLYADTWELLDKHEALRSELMQQTGVVDVAYSQFALGSCDSYMNWGRSDKNHQVQFVALPVDWHYLRTMGIEVIEGRDFNEHDGDCYVINEAARKKWDWVEMGKKLLDEDTEMTVVGVCRNVRFASTRIDNNASPMAFLVYGEKYISNGWANSLGVMNVRVAAGTDKVAMRKKIKDICMKFGAKHEPDVKFLNQQLEDTYQEEFRFIRQVMVFSVICLIITLIGRRLLYDDVRDGVPSKGDWHPQGDGIIDGRNPHDALSPLRLAALVLFHRRSPTGLVHRQPMAPRICRTDSHLLVALSAGIFRRRHHHSCHHYRPELALCQ